MKTVKFYTLGCKANQYDTQEIRERFLEEGFKEVEQSHPAQIYLINTCTVTAKADKESLYLIHRSHRENPSANIIVTGCLAELDKDKIEGQPGVSLIVKNTDKKRILRLLSVLSGSNEPTSRQKNGISHFKGHTRAFVKIQDGCDKFCAYCKVPYVRGRPKSRPIKEIIQEAERLLKNGFKEIVLTGICLGAYGKDLRPRKDLVDVINALERLKGMLRIRLSSIEAADVSDRLIRKISDSEKLCSHLHIPIQSGDDQILKKMNRKYSRQDYISLIKRIKSLVPGIAITTDVLVGFPQETDRRFKNTVSLVKKILPLRVHIFPYSPRQHTSAYNLKDRIRPEIVRKRILLLEKISRKCSQRYMKKFLGKKMRVLIEDRAKGRSRYWEGYTDNYIKTLIRSVSDLRNQLIFKSFKKIYQDHMIL